MRLSFHYFIFTQINTEAVKKILSFILVVSALLFISATSFEKTDWRPDSDMESYAAEQAWVDSIFQAMTPEERLGQLVWIRAQSDWGADNDAAVERLIKKYHIGGLCFFNPTHKGTPEKQIELTNRYQALTKHVPLFITLDAEWGAGWRYKNYALPFPRQMTLGAIQDDKLIYKMGKAIAEQMRRMGVTINFAPVVDVNNNGENPVINYRSFGENPHRVANKSYQYMRGMQDHNVMACAKHFPGHGDTNVDSHKDLPIIPHSRARLDSVELFPFQILFDQGVGGAMVAHLSVPELDPTENMPTTLSRPVITDLMKKEMNFNGLIMTDAMEMHGVVKHHGEGEASAKALAAGNDVVLLPADTESAFEYIHQYLSDNKLDQAALDFSVKKVLRWKYRMGVTEFEEIKKEGLSEDLNNREHEALRREMIAAALTLARDEKGTLDLKSIDELAGINMASVSIGAKKGNPFQRTLNYYKNIDTYSTKKDISEKEQNSLLNKLSQKDVVIVSVHDMSQFAKWKFGINQSAKNFIKKLNEKTNVVLVLFGNPYSLKYFDHIGTVLVTYEEADDIQEIAAQAIFGALPISGKLPVTASQKSKAGMGVERNSLQTLSYGLPEEVGMDSRILENIDTVMEAAMREEATPGGVVLVAKDGKVIFQKAYGKHTYSSKARSTQVDDIWDLASVTKICASTVSLMKLQEEGKFNPNDPVSKYIPEFKNTDKANIPVADMLTHRARLTAWIKFYEETVNSKKQPSSSFYKNKNSGKYTLPVAKDLYLRNDWPDTIWQRIVDSPLREKKEYKYSDLAFYIAAEIVKRQSGMPLDEYVQKTFYENMGMSTTGYNPLKKFPVNRIPPTDEDDYWRQRKVQGYVHDMGAAMLNQVSGHAGLFSNANDLAKMMQMLVNGGYYGGTQYLKPETIHQYATRCPDCTRRGLGFDMLQLDESYDPNLSTKASKKTFGHLGFTGIAAWADPENDIVYIFLSNRTYPKMWNNKLGKMNTRILAMDVVYDAIVE